jgi:hypothetical protein
MRALVCVLAVTVAGSALAARPAPGRYYFELIGVDGVDNAPANLAVKAKKVFADLVTKRGELIPTLEGAPPRTDTEAFKAYLRRKRIHAYAVNVKISAFERSLAPNEKQGRSGQILTIAMELSLIGSSIPENILSLSVAGGATVKAETGMRVLPREEEAAVDEALSQALSSALTDAVAKLRRSKTK